MCDNVGVASVRMTTTAVMMHVMLHRTDRMCPLLLICMHINLCSRKDFCVGTVLIFLCLDGLGLPPGGVECFEGVGVPKFQ